MVPQCSPLASRNPSPWSLYRDSTNIKVVVTVQFAIPILDLKLITRLVERPGYGVSFSPSLQEFVAGSPSFVMTARRESLSAPPVEEKKADHDSYQYSYLATNKFYNKQ
jgi:hypothetical protein